MREHGQFCGCETCDGFRKKLASYHPPPRASTMKWALCEKCKDRVALIGYASLGPLVLYCRACATDILK